jgi:hypothetical protein
MQCLSFLMQKTFHKLKFMVELKLSEGLIVQTSTPLDVQLHAYVLHTDILGQPEWKAASGTARAATNGCSLKSR